MLQIGPDDNYRAITAGNLLALLAELDMPLDELILEVSRVGSLNVFRPVDRDDMEWVATVDLAFEELSRYTGQFCAIPQGWKRSLNP